MAMIADIWTMTAEGSSARINRAELLRALALLVDSGQCHEVRFLHPPSAHSRMVRGDDLTAAARAIEDGADARGIYLTVNPVKPSLGNRAARHADILSRRHLFLDIDPVRPSGTSATDAEHTAARGVAEAVLADLSARGWPSPIVIDSGNGMYLIYRVDLPNTPMARQILRGCIVALATAHDTADVRIDPSVHDPNRIARLPGTMNRKGDHTHERPHRMCRLASAPLKAVPVDIEMLKALSGRTAGDPPKPEAPADDIWIMRVSSSFGDDPYAQAALRGELQAVAATGSGRNNRLYQAARQLAERFVTNGRIPRGELERAMAEAGRACGLGRDGDPGEVDRAIRNAIEAGLEDPKPDETARPVPQATKAGNPEATIGPDGRRSYPFPLIIRGSDVDPKKVSWLWQDRVPHGFLTLFAGRTSVGKSFITLDLAARLSNGADLPDSAGQCVEQANTLIISEDSHEYVLSPRLHELGADMDRICFLTWEAMASFTLSNLEMLDDAYEAAGLPRLVVVDPPTNFLGQKDEHKNAEVRGVLMGMSIWAMKHDVAVVLITHCNKGVKKEMAALDRIIGSVAWASTSRIAHLMAPDPDDPSRCIFVPLKSNIGPVVKGLAYRIEATDTLAIVRWLGEADMTGDQALQGAAKPRRVTAAEWLIEQFRERLEWPSDELFRAANEAGISRSALFEAKDVLSLPRCRRHAAENGDVGWFWWVPPDWGPLARDERD